MHQRALGLSQWTVTAATAAASITVEQPEGPAVGSVHLAAECRTGRTLAGAAGIPVRAHSEGPCLSYGFAIIFLKKDHVLQLGPEPEFAWTSVPRFLFYVLFFGLPAQCPVGGREAGRAMPGPGCKTAGRSPQGLIETPAPKEDGWVMWGCGQVSLLSSCPADI